jgi:hypothetical protein
MNCAWVSIKSKKPGWALVAHACNPSYLGGRDQENLSLKPAWANCLQNPILKIHNAKKRLVSGSSDRASAWHA